MNIIKIMFLCIIFGKFIFSTPVFSYSTGTVDYGCKNPKFRSFSPPKRKANAPVPEVDPEYEISFTVSSYASPDTIKVVARGQKLKAVVVDKNSFYQVTAKLPAQFNGKYVRVHLRTKSDSGDCLSKDGWLLKVRDEAKLITP